MNNSYQLAKSVRTNVTNAGTTHYIHNADDQIIAELDGAGNTVREYVWMNDMPVGVVEGGRALLWVHSDHLNRPVKMLDRNRNVVWEAMYEPFGTVHSITGTAANDNRFPGQLFQLETGLAYNWHRHYDATIGRYTQVDPLGLTAMLSDGPSVYGYVGQSPMMYTDPTGLEVYLCERDVDIGVPASVASKLPKHRWVKTDTMESGMGGDCPTPGQQCSDKPFSPTKTTDHTGQSKQPGSSCTKMRNVDENCVNKRLAPGQPTGRWSPVNQCQSFAGGVINSCRYGPQLGPDVSKPPNFKGAW